VLVGFTAVSLPLAGWHQGFATIALIAAAPSLVIQAIALGCVYGRAGRRWFGGRGTARMDDSA
jgi:hypothetical protein